MANVAGLKTKVTRRAERLRDLATETVEHDIDPTPYDTGELRRSRRVTRTDTPTRVSATITYTADHAKLLDKGTRPHVIRGNPTLSFFWPAPKGPGRRVARRSVNHPGSTKHRGWFSDHVTREKWRAALAAATRRT